MNAKEMKRRIRGLEDAYHDLVVKMKRIAKVLRRHEDVLAEVVEAIERAEPIPAQSQEVQVNQQDDAVAAAQAAANQAASKAFLKAMAESKGEGESDGE